jgi:hypothetical protein
MASATPNSLLWMAELSCTRFGYELFSLLVAVKMTDGKNEGNIFRDCAVGQVYRSGRLRVDKDQIIAFAAQFDPQSYHLDEAAAANRCLAVSRQGLAHRSAIHTSLVKANSDRRMASLESVSTN